MTVVTGSGESAREPATNRSAYLAVWPRICPRKSGGRTSQFAISPGGPPGGNCGLRNAHRSEIHRSDVCISEQELSTVELPIVRYWQPADPSSRERGLLTQNGLFARGSAAYQNPSAFSRSGKRMLDLSRAGGWKSPPMDTRPRRTTNGPGDEQAAGGVFTITPSDRVGTRDIRRCGIRALRGCPSRDSPGGRRDRRASTGCCR